MILKKISLSNFRNFKNQELVFNRRLTIVAGENSRGKSASPISATSKTRNSFSTGA